MSLFKTLNLLIIFIGERANPPVLKTPESRVKLKVKGEKNMMQFLVISTSYFRENKLRDIII